MLFRKTLSLLGIGAAKIDLILEKTTYSPGEKVFGYFLLKGGTIEQSIKRIHVDLIKVDTVNEQETVVDSITILSSRKLEASQDDELSFAITIPSEAEASNKNLYYYFHSILIFNEGVESRDQDIIQIKSS